MCCILINVAIEYVQFLEKPLLLISVVNFALGSWSKVRWLHEMGTVRMGYFSASETTLLSSSK